MQYTPAQLKAINHLDGNLQIIACAGSGKTQVLSQRIVNILRTKKNDGFTPANIVAFTFTEKAAGELKNRIHRLCKEQLGSDFGLAEMFVGTIHGFCLEILQTYQFRFLKYNVINEVQQRLLIDRHSNESGLTDLATHDGKRLTRWKDSRLYQKILSIVRESQIDELTLKSSPIPESVGKYERLLHSKSYLDYSMILKETVQAFLGDSELKKKISNRIKYLIVDEYQDVNPLQEQLIRILNGLGAQLCVVGDDDQTIYQWNGSDIGNIITFIERYPGVELISMGDNFRSSPGIVNTARSVIERNTDRLNKRMESRESQQFELGDMLALRFSNSDSEAQWIAEKIISLRGVPFVENGKTRGLTWSDCAILLRSVRGSAGPILEALRSAGVPYLVKGMNGLFDTNEIKAAAGIFFFLNGTISSRDLFKLWSDADLGIDPRDLEIAIGNLMDDFSSWHEKFGKGIFLKNSVFSLQHTYQKFLSNIKLREEKISNLTGGSRNRGELVYFNLGKFSQIITDFEQINWHSNPSSLYESFAGFLFHQAPEYYPEGWEEAGYSTPDAVQIMTVHQAKGVEFPVIFCPNLVNNRFPAKKQGGRKWYHVVPREAVLGGDRFEGSAEDERRLFYVALTRSKKFLYCSWSPESLKGLYSKESPLIREFAASEYVLTREPARPQIHKLEPSPSYIENEIVLTFSELKYFFECPYQFKLRFLYGFNPGLHEKLGFGKSLHDALAEIHNRAIDGIYLSQSDVPQLIDRHLHLPFAWEKLKEDMRIQADRALKLYLSENGHLLDKIEYAEKPIELKLADGIVVHGRIDLIRRTDTKQVIIIDFKSTERAQEEDVTRKQLHLYAMGYQQLAGTNADLVEIYNLDEGIGATVREVVDAELLKSTEAEIVKAGKDIRENSLKRLSKCVGCDTQGICRDLFIV